MVGRGDKGDKGERKSQATTASSLKNRGKWDTAEYVGKMSQGLEGGKNFEALRKAGTK